MNHPNAFLENCVADGKPPNRHGSFQPEAFDMHIAVGLNGSAAPAIRSQRIIRTVITGGFVELGHKLHAAYRRLKRRYQQAMIATGKIATDGTGSESSDAVGDQPLALFRDIEHSADFAAELHLRILRNVLFCGPTQRTHSRPSRCHPLLPPIGSPLPNAWLIQE